MPLCNACEEHEAVADWGVCGSCFADKSAEIKRDVFPDLYDDADE